MRKIYFHLDIETGSLDTRRGLVCSIGFVVTTPGLEILGKSHRRIVLPTMLWEQGTLSWARQLSSMSDYLLAADLRNEEVQHSLLSGGSTDKLLQGYLLPLLEAFLDDVRLYTEADGVQLAEPWLVTNHPEFDVATLKAAFSLCSLSSKWPFKHNHSLDLNSLLIGAAQTWGPKPTPTIEQLRTRWGFPRGAAVAHDALADAEEQLKILVRAGFKLP